MTSNRKFSINLIGKFQLIGQDGTSIHISNRKGAVLIAVLALSEGYQAEREVLYNLLWSGLTIEATDQKLQDNLRQCTAAIKKSMGEFAFNELFDLHQRNTIALRQDAVDVDLVRVSSQLLSSNPADLASLMGAGKLDLLGHLEIAREPELSEWISLVRTHWTDRLISGLLDFSNLLSSDEIHSERLRRASIALRLDPINEEANRAIMIAHAVQGNPLAAKRQFEKLEAVLKSEYEFVPQEETVNVYHDVTSGAVRSASWPKPSHMDHYPSERVRIAVLPFTVKPEGFEEDLLKIGICEQIIEALSRLNDFAAVAHSSVFGMSVETMSPSELGEVLHVEYIVQGSIREVSGQIKVNVQFVRCNDAEVLLTMRYRQADGNAFELEDQIARDLAGDLEVRVLKLEIDRAVRLLDKEPGRAKEFVLRAIPSIYWLSREQFDVAFTLLQKALELEPDYAPAHSWLAFWYAFYVGQGWGDDKSLEVAAQHARKAIELAPDDPRAYAISGHLDSFLMRQPELGEVMLDKSIHLNPNSGFAWAFSAINQCYLGRPDVALTRMKEYSSLCPQDPFGFYFETIYCIAHTLLGEFELGAEWGRRTTNGNPNFVNGIKPFLACLGHLGRRTEANRMRNILMAQQPDFTVDIVRRTYPLRSAEQMNLYCDGLIKAGIPEQ